MSPPQPRAQAHHRCHRIRRTRLRAVRPLKPGRPANRPRRRGTGSHAADPARTASSRRSSTSAPARCCGRGRRRRGAFGQRSASIRRGSGRPRRQPSSGALSRPARPGRPRPGQHQAPAGADQQARHARSGSRPARWSGPGDTCGGYSGCSQDTTADNVSSPKPTTCRGYSEDTQNGAGDNGG